MRRRRHERHDRRPAHGPGPPRAPARDARRRTAERLTSRLNELYAQEHDPESLSPATRRDPAQLMKQVDDSITYVTNSMTKLGTGSKALDNQLTFTSKLQDTLETGIGNLVDADLAKESAKLTALQTKQQLGVQALSIANSSSSVLLSLFR